WVDFLRADVRLALGIELSDSAELAVLQAEASDALMAVLTA
ncbi:MAG: hypothetical protein ACI9W6_000631, partial [Motiliproteus sp.]